MKKAKKLDFKKETLLKINIKTGVKAGQQNPSISYCKPGGASWCQPH